MEEEQVITDMYHRQRGIFDEAKADVPITVIGAGSLGSWAVLGLAKLGFKDITVFDFDTVELHNVPNQLYRPSTVGMFKAIALQQEVSGMTNIAVRGYAERFTIQELTPIVICLVDNMEVRERVFKRCCVNATVKVFIDGRMGGQSYRVYAVDTSKPEDQELYKRNWYPDEQGSQEECTARGVGYNAVSCAMDVVNLAKRSVMGEKYPREIVSDSGGIWKVVNW
jgi:molybdopterin/thiamine biosynthesis adenylyltransferase